MFRVPGLGLNSQRFRKNKVGWQRAGNNLQAGRTQKGDSGKAG